MNTSHILAVMGGYYLITGIWPLVHMKSFLAVTGPKVDLWLVRTVSLMITCSGIIFLMPFWRETNAGPEVLTLAHLNAASLCFIDVYYPLKGTIRKIYMADGLAEVAFIICIMCSENK